MVNSLNSNYPQARLSRIAPALLLISMTMTMGHALDRRPHGYPLGAAVSQGAQTSIGLESIWTFDDGTYRDWKGLNDLAPVGSGAVNVAKIGTGAFFSAGGYARRTLAGSTLAIATPLSYAFWGRVDSIGDFDQPTFLAYGDANNYVIASANPAAGQFTTQLVIALNYNPAFNFIGSYVFDLTPRALAQWHFIGFSVDPTFGQAILCVDGDITYQTLGTFPALYDTEFFSIGARGDGTLPLTGGVDEVAFWKRRLSVNDFLFLWNSQQGRRYPWDSGRILADGLNIDTWLYGPDGKYINAR